MAGLPSRVVAVLIALGALIGAPAAAHADQQAAIRALFAQTEELKGLQDEVAKFNPIAGGFKYDADIFGVKASLYVYFPDGGAAAPVAALLLPSVALSTIIPPLKGTPMDVTLDDPVVFAASPGSLQVDKMPQGVRERARGLGFGDAFAVDALFTVFGKVAGHQDDALHQVLRLINLNAPLIAGYSTPSGKEIQLPGPIGGKQKPKTKKLADRVLSLALPADTEWNEPFFFKHTTIKQTSVQLRKSQEADLDPSIKLRVNGRGLIGAHAAKEYDLFVEKTFDKTADPASLGVLVAVNPTGEVELTDFFAVTQALWATLGFPEEMAQGVLNAGHALPLDQVRLRNPNSPREAFPEVGGLPDFDKVMFAGANAAAKIPGRGRFGKANTGPLLTINAKAKVFGLDAVGFDGDFSLTHGLKLEANVTLPKLGPITVGKAAFDTTIDLKTAFMKLHVDALTLGKFDVDAGKDGLSFVVPAQCPGRPVGLSASIDGFDLSQDFSVKPRMKDCLTPIVKDLIGDAEKVAEVAGELAGDAAGEAEGIAKEAEGKIAGFAKARADAWGKAIANKTHADQALKEAKAAVGNLEGEIKDLGGKIDSLTHDIDKLLKKAWSFVKGEVRGKKKHRQHLIADRDNKRTELAAANQREQQAEKAAKDTPVPYHDGALRQGQADELGAMAIKAQQTKFAGQAKALPDTLKTTEGRQALFDLDAVAAAVEATFVAENGTSLNHLVDNLGDIDAVTQAAPTAEGVVASAVIARLDTMREHVLHEEVPNLPTMAFGKSVLVQTKVQDRTLCLAQVEKSGELGLSECAVAPEQVFVFSDTGQVTAPRTTARRETSFGGVTRSYSYGGPSLVDFSGGHVVLWTYDWKYDGSSGNQFFYDPLDGLIRAANGKCVVPAPKPGFGPCPQGDPSAAAWRLVDVDRFNPDSALPRAAAGGLRAASPGAAAVPEVTNLAPLGL